jgi:tetratricopeptide (TPR) repeat protein
MVMSSERLFQLMELHQENSADTFLLFAIAKEYEGLNDDGEALHYYQQLLEVDPHYVGVYYHLAKLYERRNLFMQAVETYSSGMEVARKLGDQHALAELSNAKTNLEMEL